MSRTTSRVALLLPIAACVMLAACSKPEPPERDDPPEPQAVAATAQPAELTQAIQEPLDKANAAQAATETASQNQNAAIDAATQEGAGN